MMPMKPPMPLHGPCMAPILHNPIPTLLSIQPTHACKPWEAMRAQPWTMQGP